jgi:hypothetical protein
MLQMRRVRPHSGELYEAGRRVELTKDGHSVDGDSNRPVDLSYDRPGDGDARQEFAV